MSTQIIERNLENMCRGATATKAPKARALPKFWVTVNPISTKGADYAHHSTMDLVWLKFAVAPQVFCLISSIKDFRILSNY